MKEIAIGSALYNDVEAIIRSRYGHYTVSHAVACGIADTMMEERERCIAILKSENLTDQQKLAWMESGKQCSGRGLGEEDG